MRLARQIVHYLKRMSDADGQREFYVSQKPIIPPAAITKPFAVPRKREPRHEPDLDFPRRGEIDGDGRPPRKRIDPQSDVGIRSELRADDLRRRPPRLAAREAFHSSQEMTIGSRIGNLLLQLPRPRRTHVDEKMSFH